jgi:hypothetical protein
LLSQDIQIVATGIDTVKINVKLLNAEGQPLQAEEIVAGCSEDLLMRLDIWQGEAQRKSDPIPTTLPFHEARLLMFPNGAPSWRYVLRNDCLELKIMPRLKIPMVAKVTLQSAYLWEVGDIDLALEEVKALLVDLFGDALFLQAGQLDLCVDVIGLTFPTEWERVFVTHAIGKRPFAESQKDHAYYHGRTLETILFSGHGCPVSCKLYNKTLEIEQQSKKVWMYDRWATSGKWSYEHWKARKLETAKEQRSNLDVWRVEFSIEREGFHEMGIESIEEAIRNIKRLWMYCTHEWLRMVQPGPTKNRTRWATHPAWKTLQRAFDAYGDKELDALGPLVRERKRQKNVEQGIAAIAGYATTLAAWYKRDWGEGEACINALFETLRAEVTDRWKDLGVTPQDLIRAKKFIYSQKP